MPFREYYVQAHICVSACVSFQNEDRKMFKLCVHSPHGTHLAVPVGVVVHLTHLFSIVETVLRDSGAVYKCTDLLTYLSFSELKSPGFTELRRKTHHNY